MNILALTAAEPVVIYKVDYIAITIVALLAIFVIAMVIRKHIMLKKAAKVQNFEATEVPTASEVKASGALAKGSAGKIKLHDVVPKTAAMLMAIVADKTGKPLNELRFISIKEVK